MRNIAARRRIVALFAGAAATSADRAIAFSPDPELAAVFRRMRRGGALSEAGEGRYWLDADRLGRFRAAQRRRLAALVASSGFAATLAATGAVLALVE